MQSIPHSTKNFQQRFNIRLDDCSHTTLGDIGEDIAALHMRKAGYRVKRTKTAFSGDLLATCPQTGEILKIEVKAARAHNRGKSQRWHFCLNKTRHTACGYSDFVLFVLMDDKKHFLYLIPSSLLQSQILTITSHPTRYRGKYAPFRQQSNKIDIASVRATAELWGTLQ